jgi:hypothetical protein
MRWQDERDFDLHNNFNFVGFSYSVAERVTELRWVRSSGDWVHSGIPAALVLFCRGVTQLSATARDPEMPFTEDDCLSEICFILPQDAVEDAFAVSPAAPTIDPLWHWLFSFMSGFTLRIAGETAYLSAQEANQAM